MTDDVIFDHKRSLLFIIFNLFLTNETIIVFELIIIDLSTRIRNNLWIYVCICIRMAWIYMQILKMYKNLYGKL